jgi:hypothetical protein
MRLLTCLFFACSVGACSSGNNNGNQDMAAPHDLSANGDMAGGGADMALLSQCGHPGDTGNSLGVGKFCMTIADCNGGGLKTNICSALGNGPTPSPSDTYFCTIFPCKPDGGSDCGAMATCVCAMQGCACTPDSCLGPPPDGGATD